MLDTQIRVSFHDPSPNLPTGVWAWFQTFVGDPAKAEALRLRLGEARLAVFQALIEALHASEFDDVIHVFLGDRPLYKDLVERDMDLGLAVAEVLKDDRLLVDSSDIRLVCSRRHAGLHTLVDIVLGIDEAEGRDRLSVALSGRAEVLHVRTGERAVDFASRVRETIGDSAALSEFLDAFDEQASGLALGLDRRLSGASATAEPSTIYFVRGGNREVGRFRNLTFEAHVRSPTYRAVPTHQRRGAYDRPFYYYYYDPYHDLMSWIATEAILEGACRSSRVVVVNRRGAELFRADETSGFPVERFEVPPGSVQFDDKGGIVVDESVPRESSVDPVEIGSPYTPGYGADEAGG